MTGKILPRKSASRLTRRDFGRHKRRRTLGQSEFVNNFADRVFETEANAHGVTVASSRVLLISIPFLQTQRNVWTTHTTRYWRK